MKAELLLVAAALWLAGCGVKGPPKPPLSPPGTTAQTSTGSEAR